MKTWTLYINHWQVGLILASGLRIPFTVEGTGIGLEERKRLVSQDDDAPAIVAGATLTLSPARLFRRRHSSVGLGASIASKPSVSVENNNQVEESQSSRNVSQVRPEFCMLRVPDQVGQFDIFVCQKKKKYLK